VLIEWESFNNIFSEVNNNFYFYFLTMPNIFSQCMATDCCSFVWTGSDASFAHFWSTSAAKRALRSKKEGSSLCPIVVVFLLDEPLCVGKAASLQLDHDDDGDDDDHHLKTLLLFFFMCKRTVVLVCCDMDC